MTLTDILMIAATAISPLIAVQVTRFLDDRNEERGRKLNVFKTLMATRAYNLSPAHVQALNSIDIEFSAKKASEKAVLDVWQQYLDHLGATEMEPNAWNLRRVDLLVDLLQAMGKSLNYDFNKTQIKNGTYAPNAHGTQEEEQRKIRAHVLEILSGEKPLPMHITNIPQNNASTPDGA